MGMRGENGGILNSSWMQDVFQSGCHSCNTVYKRKNLKFVKEEERRKKKEILFPKKKKKISEIFEGIVFFLKRWLMKRKKKIFSKLYV